MQDRFEPELRSALHRARVIAQSRGQHQIGTAHIALALLSTDGPGQPATVAAEALASMGIEIASLGRALQESMPMGSVRFFPVQMALDTAGGRVLQLAVTGAQQMGHGDVGSEHVLAALMQEPEGALPKALAAHGIDNRRVIETLNPRFAARPRTGSSTTTTAAPAGGGAAAGGRLTESGQRIVQAAAGLAERYGHGLAGTPHIALALLDDADRMLTSLLRRAGVNPADVRQLLLQQMRVEG